MTPVPFICPSDSRLFFALCFLAATVLPHEAAQAEAQWFLVIDASKVAPAMLDSPYQYTLRIFTTDGKQKRLLLNRALPPDGMKNMDEITRIIFKQFNLPSLDENGKIAVSGESRSPVTFVFRQSTNNRRKEVWFGPDDAQRLGLQTSIEELIAITNEQIGAKPTADLQLIRQAFERGEELKGRN
jgi:hypothetical protein